MDGSPRSASMAAASTHKATAGNTSKPVTECHRFKAR
jgi:hypothetical protein